MSQLKIFKNQFIQLIKKDIFPNNVEFNIKYNFDAETYECYIDWKLNNDQNRPNKRSKKIKIQVSREGLEDYNNKNVKQRQAAQNQFENFIKERMKRFDPNHDKPKYEEPPMEEWVVQF